MDKIDKLFDQRQDLKDHIAALQMELAALDAEIVEEMGQEKHTWGGKVYAVRRETKVTWDNPLLLRRIAREALLARVPDKDGVVGDPVEQVLSVLDKTAAITYWRTTALKDYMGKDEIDKYRETDYGRPRPVQIGVADRVREQQGQADSETLGGA